MSPKSPWCMTGLCCPGMAEHLPAYRKRWNNSLFCFACVPGFCLLHQTVFLPWVFSFPLLWFSPILLQGQWVSSCVGLGCQLGLNRTEAWFFSFILRQNRKFLKFCVTFQATDQKACCQEDQPDWQFLVSEKKLKVFLFFTQMTEKQKSTSEVDMHVCRNFVFYGYTIYFLDIFSFFSWHIALDLLKRFSAINDPLKDLKKMSAEEQSQHPQAVLKDPWYGIWNMECSPYFHACTQKKLKL